MPDVDQKAPVKRPYGVKAIPVTERRAHRVDEAAAALGICRDTVYTLIRSGHLQSIKLGKTRLVTNLDAVLRG